MSAYIVKSSSYGLFEKLSNDQIIYVSMFLNPIDVNNITLTCKHAPNLEYYWVYIAQKLISDTINLPTEIHFKENREAKKIVLDLIFNDFPQTNEILNQLTFTLTSSTVDREEENAYNTLRKSSCLTIFSSFSASEEDLSALGLYSQVDKTYKKYTYDYTYANF